MIDLSIFMNCFDMRRFILYYFKRNSLILEKRSNMNYEVKEIKFVLNHYSPLIKINY